MQALASADPLAAPSLARELTRTYMIWDAYVCGARRVDLHPLILPPVLHRAAVLAAESVTRAVGQVAARAHDDAAERALYRVRPHVAELAAASHAARDDASLVRVDLLLTEDGGVQACEINSDCAGGHNEALGLPRLSRAAGFTEGHNPTSVVEALVARLIDLAHGDAVGLIFATAHAEDLQICALLERELRQRGVRAIRAPATAPRLRDGRIAIGRETVGVLYRYFPTEYMEGQRNVPDLARAVARGDVRTMTSFSHIYLQSKYAFARTCHYARSFASGTDADAVARYLPPTFDVADLSGRELVAERGDWVLKRAYGRVGDEVFVGALVTPERWGPLVDEVLRLRASGESWIAQRFVRQRSVPTPYGPRYVTLGAYVLDGTFAGYFARLSPASHVSHDALVVPVFHLREEPS